MRKRRERYCQTVFYLIFKLLGLQAGAEVRTSRGRIDAVVEVKEAVTIFEFKIGGDAAIRCHEAIEDLHAAIGKVIQPLMDADRAAS